jgi:hypothetical protein
MCCCFFCRVAALFFTLRIVFAVLRLFLILILVTVAAAPAVAAARLARDAFETLGATGAAAIALGALCVVWGIVRRRRSGRRTV